MVALLWLAATVLIPPFSLLLAISLVLATFGKTLGLRRLYVILLLKLFEYGRVKIEKHHRRKNLKYEAELEPSTNPEGEDPKSHSAVSVISRETCIGPDPDASNKQNGDLKSSNGISNGAVYSDDVELNNRINQEKSRDGVRFHLEDVYDFVRSGMEAIIDDEVTKRFSAEELPSWNLLTRTNNNYHYLSLRLSLIWFVGFVFRYGILLPIRVMLTWVGVGWLCVCTAFIGYVPNGKFKRWLNWHTNLMCFRIMSRAFSAIITYHDRQNKAQGGGICVANHTSPIDVVILACDNCYALIGQRHSGFLGILQRALARSASHIWFERSEVKDRSAVTRRLKEHTSKEGNLPILIFPEGTCINNTSVMQFKKGSFEIGSTIYPVAIKYDSRFGDPFWNSSKYGMVAYLLMMMTSWAIVCDVWYLPPMTREEGEDAIDFANRVKAAIALAGGLVDLMWDGQLKRMQVKKEWKEKHQEAYSQRIKAE